MSSHSKFISLTLPTKKNKKIYFDKLPKIIVIKRNTQYSSSEKIHENPVVIVMGNSFEKFVSAAGGREDWSRCVANGQRKNGNSHKRLLQCQLCKKYQQQCLTCGAYGGADVGGSSMLHVSSTPNLGGGYLHIFFIRIVVFFLAFWEITFIHFFIFPSLF